METQKGFSDTVESWLSRIPGVNTYRAREERRETDKRLRSHMASRLREAHSQLILIAQRLQKAGLLDPLDELDRLSSQVQQMTDTIRYASYGYSGIFCLEKIREEELDRLYAFDLSLMDDLDLIMSSVGKMHQDFQPGRVTELIRETANLVHALEKKFHQRRSFIGRSV